MNIGNLLKLSITLLCLPMAYQALATDFTVGSTSSCTLPDAIQAANQNQAVGNCPAGDGDDTIYLADNITLDANLPTIVSNITVASDNYRFKRVINGNRAHPIFNVEDGGRLTLRQLDLINGHSLGMHGGAVRLVQGNAHMTDVRLENNWAQLGGGALSLIYGSSVTCSQCQFVDNHCGQGGAIWVGDQSSSIVLNNSLVYNNSADRGGGMFIRGGSATIAGTTFSNNVAGEGHDLLSIDAEVVIEPDTIISPGGHVRASQ